MQFSPTDVDFGDVDIGSEASTEVAITNQSTGHIAVSDVQVSGQGFTVQGQQTLPMALGSGSSRRVALQFSPDSEADFTGQVTAVDNQNRPVASIRVHGRGRIRATHRLSVSTSSLDFGNVLLNSTTTRSLTLTSTGTGSVTIDSAVVSGSAFTVAGASFPLTLQAGQSSVLRVEFAPGAAAVITGQLSIHSNSATGNTTAVSLTGTGTAVAAPRLSISTNNLSFGNVTLDTSAAKTITLTSTGTGPVTVRSVTIAGNGYTVSGAALPVSLNPGASLTLQVSFLPKVAGTSPGTLAINSDGSTTTVALTGAGVATSAPQLTLNTASLSFGNVTVNSRSTKTVTLSSTGTETVTISSMKISGSGFSMPSSTFPIKLDPGQARVVQITFDPTVAGASTGAFTIASDSSTGGTISVPLSGTGTSGSTPTLSISTTSLDFGSTPLGAPVIQILTLSSTGTSAVTVSRATVSGSAFAISGVAFPVTLNPGIAVKLTVTFNPLSQGTSTGQVTITSNSSSGSTSVVTLAGAATEAEHQVDLTWSAPSNSPVKVTGYSVYRAASGSSVFSLLNASIVTQTSYVDNSVQSGMKYTYYATSVDASGAESMPSGQVTVTIP